jgi:hypothetical protein
MQRFATVRPIWQGIISAAITIAVGLLLLTCIRALSHPVNSGPSISDKAARNVEWETWSTTVDILTRGVIDRNVSTGLFDLIPEELGGPYQDLTFDLVLNERAGPPRGPRMSQRMRRIESRRSGRWEPPPWRPGPRKVRPLRVPGETPA